MNIGSKLIQFIFVLLIIGCSSLPEERHVTPNPTRYVFSCSMDTLRDTIISEFDVLKFKGMMLYYKGSSYPPLDTLEIFEIPDNRKDFYLKSSFVWIGNSYVYPSLKYTASFHLHLVQINNKKTEVIVNTIKPMVILGKELIPSFPHFARGYKFREVSPSTIEEYEILFRIGKSLGEEMPEVIYPADKRASSARRRGVW